jgi:hypothetical protein
MSPIGTTRIRSAFETWSKFAVIGDVNVVLKTLPVAPFLMYEIFAWNFRENVADVTHGVPSQGFTRDAETTKVGSAFELTETVLDVIWSPLDGYDWYGAIGSPRAVDPVASNNVIAVELEAVLTTLMEPAHVVPTMPGSFRKKRTSVSLPRTSFWSA